MLLRWNVCKDRDECVMKIMGGLYNFFGLFFLTGSIIIPQIIFTHPGLQRVCVSKCENRCGDLLCLVCVQLCDEKASKESRFMV